jgi:acyl-ACP thioesterase
MSGVLGVEFPEPVPGGRVYRASRHIHLGDVGSQGDLRLEALARFLQDVATDDALDGDLRAQLGGTWVLRRLAVEIRRAPHFNDDVEFSTFCSGVGPAWAERRTDVRTPDGDLLARTVAIWVLIDQAGGRPIALPDEFFAIYGTSARGRKVSGRLRNRRPSGAARSRVWPLRESDFDFLDHVNNARYLEAVEDELTIRLPKHQPVTAELEFRGAVERGESVDLVAEVAPSVEGEGELLVWLMSAGEVRMSARVCTRFVPTPARPLPK